ncbi:FAM91A1-like protein [Drosera capensis]
MQHAPVTIEEQLIVKAIKEECPWENLPKRLQSTLSSKEEWHRRVNVVARNALRCVALEYLAPASGCEVRLGIWIIDHCVRKRLQWNTCFARKVIKESEYYEEMMRYLRRNLALFPYHLAEYICRVMRVSPFRYYCDMLFEVMKNEQPYDSIPNFSAADALRLTGIGRNEFIDIMNKCRSKKFMWKINKSIAKDLLPVQPVDFAIEPWWAVGLVNFTLEEFKKLSEEEMSTIDKVCKEEANSFVLFDPDIIKGLYRRGLIYFDVPVYAEDRFKVSRLEGFVSNREQSYEDPIEELLYAVFVVAGENATVADLASTLQADLFQLQAAASFACRLGWAVKLIDPASALQETSLHGALGINLSDDEEGSQASVGSANMSADGNSILLDTSAIEGNRPAFSNARVAFIVDANITSYLMMGSVSPGGSRPVRSVQLVYIEDALCDDVGYDFRHSNSTDDDSGRLKFHAVTLYEAGKLGHASIPDLCKDLGTLEGAKFEGELQEFANHASSLRHVLECLISGGVSADTGEVGSSDKIGMLCVNGVASASVDTTQSDKPEGAGINESNSDGGNLRFLSTGLTALQLDAPISSRSPQESSVDAVLSSEEHNSEMSSSILQNDDLSLTEDSRVDSYVQNGEKTISLALENANEPAKKRSYFVDLLRCESLANLAPATLDRLFRRDYDIVLSMVPLPPSSILPGTTGPVHFGPPSHSCMTPWMKLVLYSAVGNGPLSVVLMKGQCLRLLPAPLAGCEKALIWSWDGSSIGGLGGKFGGNLVKGNVLLHCLNSLLRHSAVLVQPLSKNDLDDSCKAIMLDIPLPLKNSDGSVLHVGEELGLGMKESAKLNSVLSDVAEKIDLWTIGYIRLLKLYLETETDHFLPDDDRYEWVPLSVEFGVPLFGPKLCECICKRVTSSQLLQTESFNEHHEAMQSLRKMLREICSEYSATGPTAKILYQKEKPKDSSKQLMNYASGRWNPLMDPSSPISGVSSEHQRLRLATRQRSRREVLSFDGSILRSYALTPVYEAATRPIDELVPLGTTKAEADDADSKEVTFPGVNLLFDGSELHPFDIGACLQARQPVSLIAEASSASAAFAVK